MRKSTLILGLLAIVTASVATSSTVRAAEEEPFNPQQVAHACVHSLQHITTTTVSAVRSRAMAGVHRIHQLVDAGAPDAVVLHTGQMFVQAVNEAASNGAQRVNMRAAQCITALQEHDAPQPLIAFVIQARTTSLHVIGRAREAGVMAVQRAVAHALDDSPAGLPLAS